VVSRVLVAAEELCNEIESFSPALYSGADCALLAEALAKTEKACAGARARAAARAVACGAHRDRGYPDGADWLAQKTGTSRAEARTDLETAGSLQDMPATADAVSRGELSLKEAAEVARGEAERPGSEEELVELAKDKGLGAVREEVRKRALETKPAEDLAARQHRARSFRHWLDELGMVRFSGALPPTVGIGIVNRIEAEAGRLRKAAGPAGREEGFDAHAADALVKMLPGLPGRPGGRGGPGRLPPGPCPPGRDVPHSGGRAGDRRLRPRDLRGRVHKGRRPRRRAHRDGGPLWPPHPRRAAHRPRARGASRLRRRQLHRARLQPPLRPRMGPRRPRGP